MHVTLLVPDLFWPRDDGGGAYRGLELPSAELLLARATSRRFPSLGTEAWLCQAFEVERQQDWPVAPLTLGLDGGDPGNDYWLRADPVHFAARRDRITLLDAGLLNPRAEDAAEFAALLNRHFTGDQLVFQAPHPARWYLKVPGTPRLSTHELSLSAGRDVATLMPTGEDSPRWRRVLTEVQMLLHDHTLNQQREARGELPINSIWLWGGGRRPAVSGRHFTHVAASNAALALALAVRSGAETVPMGDLLAGGPAMASRDTRALIVADAPAAAYGDDQSWQGTLIEIERDWFTPLLTALRHRSIEELAVVALHPRACLRFEVTPTDLLKLWRRPRPLASHAPGTA
jgi:hypothetical protein